MNLEFKRKLPTLQEIKAMYPLDDALAAHKKDTDATLKNIFSGKDNRLLLVIGPCSADREDAVLDYISRLRRVQERSPTKSSSCRAFIPTNRARPATVTRECCTSPIPTPTKIC